MHKGNKYSLIPFAFSFCERILFHDRYVNPVTMVNHTKLAAMCGGRNTVYSSERKNMAPTAIQAFIANVFNDERRF